MAKGRSARGGRQNAAQARPPDATRPARADEQKPVEVPYDPGLVDLGDDVARGAEEGGSPRLPERGTLEGGIDAGLTDLGDDVARGAEEGGSPRLPERGTLEGGIDAGLTDLGDDVARPADLDEDERPR